MKKSEALELLGGSAVAAAAEIGVTSQAISGWPEELPPRIADRVQAALWRRDRRKTLAEEIGVQLPQANATASQEASHV